MPVLPTISAPKITGDGAKRQLFATFRRSYNKAEQAAAELQQAASSQSAKADFVARERP